MKSKWLEDTVLKSWWVAIFLICCYIFYESASQELGEKIQRMEEKIEGLKERKKELLKKKDHLELQINNQSDYSWVEFSLIKGLGLVPEGQRKVFFFSDPLQQTGKEETS